MRGVLQPRTLASGLRQLIMVIGLFTIVTAGGSPVANEAAAEEPSKSETKAPHVLIKTKFGEMEAVLFPD
ncbi:MAG: hypothetical protein KC588_19265, partial [Nitrospira sp.]|nr:hypothetical protein [Nitrospira sp.]